MDCFLLLCSIKPLNYWSSHREIIDSSRPSDVFWYIILPTILVIITIDYSDPLADLIFDLLLINCIVIHTSYLLDKELHLLEYLAALTLNDQ